MIMKVEINTIVPNPTPSTRIFFLAQVKKLN